MKNLTSLLLLCALPTFAQIPEAPKPNATRRQIIIANLAMYGASVLGAHATYYGTQQCYKEDLKVGNPGEFGVTAVGGGVFHPWRRSFTMSLPADAAVSLASYLLHRRRHNLVAVILPSASAGMQIGIAGVQYSQGCF
jgi:hypothetical protein